MTPSHTPKIEEVSRLLSALRLSTDHLIQLIEMKAESGENHEALVGPIERAMSAHSQIVATLGEALKTEHLHDPVGPRVQASVNNRNDDDPNWVEAPWKYLNIPSKERGRLGPMPRFVPVPSPKKGTE